MAPDASSPSLGEDRRRCSSILGSIVVVGLELGLPPASTPEDFTIEAACTDAELPAVAIAQHDAQRFTLSAPGFAMCDVNLVDRSIRVRAAVGQARDRVAHYVADDVLPRVAGLDGICLHAAAVAVDDRAFVLIGPSGAGKSTLAARLALQGAVLLGDDAAYVKDGFVHPAHRPSRLWPDSVALLGLPSLTPDGTGKVRLAEPQGVLRGTSPIRMHEALVVDATSRAVELREALDLVLHETLRLVVPPPPSAFDRAVQFIGSFGPTRTIPRDATLDDLRAM